MSAPTSSVAGFGVWLRRKRNAYMFSTIAWGLPMWAWMAWLTQEFSSSVGWIIFVGLVSLSGGWLWGFFMWRFFESEERAGERDR